jgi:hypothetical protein
MRTLTLLSLTTALLFRSISALEDKCPKSEPACHDIINSSQCIEQLIIEKLAPLTKEALIKCVEYEGTVTNLPGAAKVRYVGNPLKRRECIKEQ